MSTIPEPVGRVHREERCGTIPEIPTRSRALATGGLDRRSAGADPREAVAATVANTTRAAGEATGPGRGLRADPR